MTGPLPFVWAPLKPLSIRWLKSNPCSLSLIREYYCSYILTLLSNILSFQSAVFSSHRAALAGSLHRFTTETWHPARQSTRVGHERPGSDVREEEVEQLVTSGLVSLDASQIIGSSNVVRFLSVRFQWHPHDVNSWSSATRWEELNSATTG